MTYRAHPLVQALAEAISGEETRHLAGDDPTGGHGYYAPGVVAAIAALRWMAQDMNVGAFSDNDYGAIISRRRLADSYLQLSARLERSGGQS